ncbi:hypothetical protein UFOVP236_20 [uncultured Caudovirales phage]|uniref:Uncharacterized protein n=1 Tax=uncultured Caudovirales phage TaxID=2100421 RepID=A0A6J7WUC9_9CAUD|nr:hypothetical protein UFOVP236_20 [uncultured Caudovirales phage]
MKLDTLVYRQAELQSSEGGLVYSIPLNQYMSVLDSLPSFSITYANRCVGGAVMRENRFHIAVLPEFRGLVGTQIIRAMEWGFTLHDPYIAMIERNNKDALRLAEFFNHTLIGQDASTLTFLLKPRGRKNVIHS